MSAAFEAAEKMEFDASAVRLREETTSSTPRGRASLIVRGMARRGGSIRRSLKHLRGSGGARDGNSVREAGNFTSGKERVASGANEPERVEMLEEVRGNGVSDGEMRSTWSERYSTWRRSLRTKASKNAEPAPPDDAVVPSKTCCVFSR